jgi:hypothetical protein
MAVSDLFPVRVAFVDGDGRLTAEAYRALNALFLRTGSFAGPVTSVALTAPTGLSVAGTPLTGAGTLVLSYTAGYSLPTNASQSEWDTAFGWGNHATAGYLTAAAAAATYQPLDGDLTSWAAVVRAAGLDDFAATPSSANLRALVTDESGTGALLFAGGDIGAATGTSLAVTGALTSSGGGIGYTAGGTVIQATDKATGVTLDELAGTITMNGAALNAATTVTFTLTNSFIGAGDMVLVQHTSAGTLGAYNFAVAPGAGSADISVRNVHTGNLSEAIVLRFVVIKAATA